MRKFGMMTAVAGLVVLQACATTPEQQRQAGCIGASVTGALAGAAIGNQLGGGTGQDILTAGGGAAGAVAGAQVAGC